MEKEMGVGSECTPNRPLYPGVLSWAYFGGPEAPPERRLGNAAVLGVLGDAPTDIVVISLHDPGYLFEIDPSRLVRIPVGGRGTPGRRAAVLPGSST
jgi:hypothetical protein